MLQISSKLTPVLKYVLPWTIIIFLSVALVLAFYHAEFPMVVAVLIIGIPAVSFMRNMFMGLKTVYIDRENKSLIVGRGRKEIVKYQEIKEIFRPTLPPYIISVRVKNTCSFGKTFLFIHHNHPMFFDGIDEELRPKLKN